MCADKGQNSPDPECREPDISSSKFDLRTGCFGSLKTEGKRRENEGRNGAENGGKKGIV